MPLFFAEVIEKPNGVKTRGKPIGPLRRLLHDTHSVSGIVLQGSRMIIGHARPEISSIMEDMGS